MREGGGHSVPLLVEGPAALVSGCGLAGFLFQDAEQ